MRWALLPLQKSLSTAGLSIFLFKTFYQHAPSDSGKRHVASILLAYPEPDRVADIATLWFDDLFVHLYEASVNDDEMWPSGVPDPEEEKEIVKIYCAVMRREPVCPITQETDRCVHRRNKREDDDAMYKRVYDGIPRLRAVSIIPEFLLRFKDEWDTTRSLLHSWTGIEFDGLLNDPTAYIGLSRFVKDLFVTFGFYFDMKDDQLCTIQGPSGRNLALPRDHRFKEGTAPRSDLLAIHASIAIVMLACRTVRRRRKNPSSSSTGVLAPVTEVEITREQIDALAL